MPLSSNAEAAPQLTMAPLPHVPHTGGTVEDPEPLPGNRMATLYAVHIAGGWTPKQIEHQQAFIQALTEDSFQAILRKHHIDIP